MENNSLIQVRNLLKERGLQALIIPISDPHKSEYIADCWKTIQWISGFTGSAGMVVITHDKAILSTDSRYFIQAEKQLNKSFVLQKQTSADPYSYLTWINNNMQKNAVVGFDGELFSVGEIQHYNNVLSVNNISLKDCGGFFYKAWQNRPNMPTNPIIEHELNYCGQTRKQKIQLIKDEMKREGATNLLITKLDDIAWLLNIRGNDIDYNPVVLAYLLISAEKNILFINSDKIDKQLLQTLNNDNISIQPYESVADVLSQITKGSNILLEQSSVNFKLFNSISSDCQKINKTNIIAKHKAIKNKVEISNYYNAQIKDGIALCSFLQWLEQNFDKEEVTELSASAKLEVFRSSQKGFKGISFGSISAFGANSALPHYSPTNESDTPIDGSNLYLIDSGGQYLDGTTDITRTICLGEPSKEQIEDFTLVLKGHISLATATFPQGTTGHQLDLLARQFLWQKGKDYGHGTGHGVGFFLNVHEGPQGISANLRETAVYPIQAGMLISNEPGFYIEGKYGIRIENIILCKQKQTTEFGNFLQFETVSYCPIELSLIDKQMLSDKEISWLNAYHKRTYELLSPYANDSLKTWLQEKTRSI